MISMRKKQVILSIILLLVGTGIYFFQENKSRSANQSADTNETISTLPKTAEDLVKQSANEIVDPGLQQKNKSSNSQETTVSSICLDQNSTSFDCYELYFKDVVKAKGVSAAFVDLKQRYPQSPYIQSQCHPITHVIGNQAALIYSDVGIAYTKGDSYCWSGYYHGVMEGVIGVIPRESLPTKINGICTNIPGKSSYSFDYYNCVHGLGHGVMAITQNELFDSLKLCDNLVGTWEQSSCHGGAFMENVIVDNKNHFTEYLKPEEPLYPCTAVDDKYKGTCYLMQTSYMLKVTNSDFSKVFELCSQVGTFAATCYQSLGRDASGRSISNVTATKNTCDLGKDYDQKVNCIIGAVKDFVSYHHSDVQAKELCSAIAAELQPTCFSTVESYYKSF